MQFTYPHTDKTTDNMKKVFATIAAIALASSMIFAQDINEATEIYNAGAAALGNSEKAEALSNFEKALSMAESLGEAGADLLGECKGIIPNLKLSIAKDLVKAADFDGAVAKLADAKETAEKFGAEDVLSEITELLPQVLLSKGNSLLTAKDYAGAAAVYKEIVDADETNGIAALRLGQALNAAGDTAGAVEAFTKAAANGQEANANKQLGNISLKSAAAALKEKKFADAIASALKANEYGENPQAFMIAAQASQLSGKNADAIKYFEKYLEVAPTAKNAGQIAYTVGALYQQAKNTAKAKEYYTKALSDPKYGAEAKKLLDALK